MSESYFNDPKPKERVMTHSWNTRECHPGRFGEKCRIVTHEKRVIVVEFEDGATVLGKAGYLRKI